MMLLARTLIISLVLLCTSCARASEHSPLRYNRRPHIVLVIADDLGWHDVSYHGSKIQTPTLDRLSKNGVRLDNYYVQPICSPTRLQLMSGRYQIHMGLQHSVFSNEQPIGLPLDVPTLPEKLREAGYATHLIGKWHLGFYKESYMPNNRGFDTAFGYLGGHEDHYNHSDTFESYGDFLDLRADGAPALNYSGVHSTYMYTDHAINLINNHEKEKPMILYLAFQSPHSPLQVPDIYEEPYKDIKDKGRRTFAGMVSMLDEGVANVTKALKNAGLWEDTIFVFSTDNGANTKEGHKGNNSPLRGEKFQLWEGGVRGVGFVTAGGNIDMQRGVINKQLMHVSDWFPTLIGVAGGSINSTQPLDGVDQWKSISNGAPTTRNFLLHNIDSLQKKKGKRMFNDTFDTRVRAALRVGDMKILTGDVGKGDWVPPPESDQRLNQVMNLDNNKKNLWLFNITADPEERHDLSGKEPDMVKDMLDMLVKLNATALPVYWPDKDPKSDPRKHGNVWSPWM